MSNSIRADYVNKQAFERVDRDLAAVIANLRTAADEVEQFRAALKSEIETVDRDQMFNNAASYLVTNIADRVMGSVSHGTARAMRSAASAMVGASMVEPADNA